MLFCEIYKALIGSVFVFLTVPHDFNIEVFSKLFLPPQQCFFGLFFSEIQDFRRNLAVEIAGKHNESFFISLYNFTINPRHIVKPFRIGYGRHLGKVLIPLFVLGQHYDLIPVILVRFIVSVFTNKEFTTDNWFYFLLSTRQIFFTKALIIGTYFLYEMKCTHHVAVVGKGNCRHVIPGSFIYQFLDTDGRLKHRKLGVVVQMHKRSIQEKIGIFCPSCRIQIRTYGGGLGRKCLRSLFEINMFKSNRFNGFGIYPIKLRKVVCVCL